MTLNDMPSPTLSEPDFSDAPQPGWSAWLRFSALWLVLGGLAYPAVTTALGGALFPAQATGSLIRDGGRVVGSALIGQPFTGDRYFIGRPSAAGSGYDPVNASGSNLAVSNPALRERVQAQAQAIAARENIPVTRIPVDLLTASGSGLDPHVSPAGAAVQVARVARARPDGRAGAGAGAGPHRAGRAGPGAARRERAGTEPRPGSAGTVSGHAA